MFHFISACNYHVISNSCDTFHANKDGIQFGLENVLGNHCANGQSCPLESTKGLHHAGEFPGIWMKYHHPVLLFEIHHGENCHTFKFCSEFINRACVIGLSLQCLIKVPRIQADPQFSLNGVIWGMVS